MTKIPANASRHLAQAAFILCTLILCTVTLGAQSTPHAESRPDPSAQPVRIFALHNATQQNDANEILTGLRLMLDANTKIYLFSNEQRIALRGTPDQIALAEKLIAETDKPHQAYKLTYIITDRDGTRVVGVQRFSIFMVLGGHTTLKTGSKVPVITGTTTLESHAQSQISYLDIGLNLEASIEAAQNELRLNSKVEQSSVLEDKSVFTQQDPVVRQTVLQGSFTTTPGKPTLLGSIDTPGSTRHLDIEALIDLIK